MGDRCACATSRAKTKRNQGSDDAKKANNGARADREVFSRLPNRLKGDPEFGRCVKRVLFWATARRAPDAAEALVERCIRAPGLMCLEQLQKVF